MKKSIRNLIIGAAMTAGIFAASTSALAGQFVQTDMNFRSGASITSTVIGSVPAGAEVEVLGSQNGWDLISYNGVTGYISGGNLGSSFTYQPAAQTQTAPLSQASRIQVSMTRSLYSPPRLRLMILACWLRA